MYAARHSFLVKLNEGRDMFIKIYLGQNNSKDGIAAHESSH